MFCSMSSGGEGGGQQLGRELSGCFLAFVSAAAAFAFLLYGGRLWLMLRRFPIESRGRRKKLREVGLVTSICATCFLFRCGRAWVLVVVGAAAFTLQEETGRPSGWQPSLPAVRLPAGPPARRPTLPPSLSLHYTPLQEHHRRVVDV